MGADRGQQKQTKPENSEEPVYQEVILYRRVSRFIERKLQPNVGSRVLAAVEGLKDPVNRRGSLKIQGRPSNDPMFRIDKGAYRIYYKRIKGKFMW